MSRSTHRRPTRQPSMKSASSRARTAAPSVGPPSPPIYLSPTSRSSTRDAAVVLRSVRRPRKARTDGAGPGHSLEADLNPGAADLVVLECDPFVDQAGVEVEAVGPRADLAVEVR